MFRGTDDNGGRLWNWSSRPPAVLKEPTFLKWSVATDSESGLIFLPLEYEEKEVVLTEGVDHHLLYFFPLYHTFAFSPVVEEKFLVADLLRYPEGFPVALLYRASFWMGLRSSDSFLPIRNLDIYLHGLWCLRLLEVFPTEDQITCPSLEGKTTVSLRGSGMGDLSNISRLLDRVKLDKVPIRRSCETPRLWSTCRRDLS